MKAVKKKVSKLVGVELTLGELIKDYIDDYEFYIESEDNSWRFNSKDDTVEVFGPKKGLTLENIKIRLTNGPASSEN